MSIEHDFGPGRVEISVVGRVTPDELYAGFRSALDDPPGPPTPQLLIDVSRSDTLPPIEILRGVAEIIADRCDVLGGRVAVFVASDVRFGLARQLGAWLERCGIEVHPFRDRREAIQWLGGSAGTPG